MSQPAGPPPYWAVFPGSPPRRNGSAKCYPPAAAGPSRQGSSPPPAAGASPAPVFVYETSWIVPRGHPGPAAGSTPPAAALDAAAAAARRWEGAGAAAAAVPVPHGSPSELRFAHAPRAAVPSFPAATATADGGRLGDNRDEHTWERGSEPLATAATERRVSEPASSASDEYWRGSGGAAVAGGPRDAAEWKLSGGGGLRAGDMERSFYDIQQDPAFFSSFKDLEASGYRADDSPLAAPQKSGPHVPFPFFSPNSGAVAPTGEAVSLLSIECQQDRLETSGSSQANVIFTSSTSPPRTLMIVSPTITDSSNAYAGTESVISKENLKMASSAGAGSPISLDRGHPEPANPNWEARMDISGGGGFFDSLPYAQTSVPVLESASLQVTVLPQENDGPQIMEPEVERALVSSPVLEGPCLTSVHSEQILISTDKGPMLVNDTKNEKMSNEACQVDAQHESRAVLTVPSTCENADPLFGIESSIPQKIRVKQSSSASKFALTENSESGTNIHEHFNAAIVDNSMSLQCDKDSLPPCIGSEGMQVISEGVQFIPEDSPAISKEHSEERPVISEETPVISAELPATTDEVLSIVSKTPGTSAEMLVESASMLPPSQLTNGQSMNGKSLPDAMLGPNILNTDALTPRISLDGSAYINVGLGLMLEQDLGTMATKVIGVVEGFAADHSGLISTGDVIKAINGEDVTQLTLLEIKRRMLGPVGTACMCLISREYVSHEIRLVRCSRGSGTKQVTWSNAAANAANAPKNFQAKASKTVGIVLQRSAEQVQCSTRPGGTVGLGMRLEIDCSALPSGAIVREITIGSAAHKSGKIVIGDILESIDGISVLGLSLHRIRDLAMGAPGTLCNVRLRRRGNAFDVTLSRIGP